MSLEQHLIVLAKSQEEFCPLRSGTYTFSSSHCELHCLASTRRNILYWLICREHFAIELGVVCFWSRRFMIILEHTTLLDLQAATQTGLAVESNVKYLHNNNSRTALSRESKRFAISAITKAFLPGTTSYPGLILMSPHPNAMQSQTVLLMRAAGYALDHVQTLLRVTKFAKNRQQYPRVYTLVSADLPDVIVHAR